MTPRVTGLTADGKIDLAVIPSGYLALIYFICIYRLGLEGKGRVVELCLLFQYLFGRAEENIAHENFMFRCYILSDSL